ncbi:MAG TPA: hypothetical protein VN367_03185 [Chlorobaculum sp.]|nr:hypothetical protein [Chlorobaculum sp.]
MTWFLFFVDHGRKSRYRKGQKKSRITDVMIRLAKKRSMRVSSVPAEQHHSLRPVITAGTAGATGVEFFDDFLHV